MAYTTINKPSDYFNTKLYTGTGSELAVTGVGFQPDWTWIKNRDTTDWHRLLDSVRGATKELYSNESNVEATQAQSLKSFDSNGFTLGTLAEVNTSGEDYASWNWLANGAGSSNTDGSITATVSANTTAGFSIIDFTGTEANGSVGHGLGVAPSMFIMKRYTDDGYSTSAAWYTYHKSLASNNYLELQSTATVATNDGSLWNTSTPVTSSVINIGFNANSNHTGNKTIIYAFAEKTGYSKFGSYLGNESSNGTFIYTGFKPAFFITKCRNTGNTQDWVMKDNRRPGYNQIDDVLYPNGNYAEGHGADVDFLSNGIKIRSAAYNINRGGGNEYIYMAFAEAPLVGTNGVTAKAR